jgi:hypothetical protein
VPITFCRPASSSAVAIRRLPHSPRFPGAFNRPVSVESAALSMAPVFELYSWQDRAAIYSMILDVEEIGKDRANLVQLPDPTLLSDLPDEVADFFRKPMSWPDARDQELFTMKDEGLAERLGTSGTIVYMPQCDRLTYAQARTLAEHAVKEMSRVYRRAISDGLQLYINNRPVEAFDPMYAMANARHAKFLEGVAKTGRLIIAKPVNIKLSEFDSDLGTAQVNVKIFKLPIEEWQHLSRKTLKNDLRVFDGLTVSILRNGREVFAGPMPKLTTRHSVTHWYRIQIEFTGALDEAFGVAANKQGVRLKGYVEKAIKDAIGEDITTINDEIKRFQAEQRELRTPAKSSASEIKANEADPFQMKGLDTQLSPEEEAQLEANLRGLALTLKRPNETDEQAYERIKNSKYVITFRHDDYWPFYDVKHNFGRVILTINTAHPFYSELYEPLRKLETPEQPEGGDEEEGVSAPAEAKGGPGMALDLLLLSLARTQSRLSGSPPKDAVPGWSEPDRRSPSINWDMSGPQRVGKRRTEAALRDLRSPLIERLGDDNCLNTLAPEFCEAKNAFGKVVILVGDPEPLLNEAVDSDCLS